MDDWLLQNLVCPRDRQDLTLSGTTLACSDDHQYSIVDDIPVMIFPDERPTHDYLRQSLEKVERIRNGELPEDVLRKGDTTNGVDGFVQDELPYTNGNLYFSVRNRLTRYPLPYLRLPASDGKRLLDVGCNWGRWTIQAAQKGYRPVGIDPSLDAVMAGRRISGQLGVDAAFVVADARYLPFREGCFDVTFSYGVLQHFSKENARTALAEMDRVLSDGGNILVQMPNKFGVRSFQQRWRRGFSEGEGFQVRYWTPSELIDAFRDRFGNVKLTADCYFGLGIQASDVDLLPAKYRAIVHLSELLRKVSKNVKALARVADSVYLESTKATHHLER
ncbi:MAG TPA: methyltransferase domain-containing protein [Pyrinomonadaceae bacterium]